MNETAEEYWEQAERDEVRWEVSSAAWGDKGVIQVLEQQGWEPFGVAQGDSGPPRIFYRMKKVRRRASSPPATKPHGQPPETRED